MRSSSPTRKLTRRRTISRGVPTGTASRCRRRSPQREIDSAGSVGRIELEILGRDAWLPESLYLFGLDTPPAVPRNWCRWCPARTGKSGTSVRMRRRGVLRSSCKARLSGPLLAQSGHCCRIDPPTPQVRHSRTRRLAEEIALWALAGTK